MNDGGWRHLFVGWLFGRFRFGRCPHRLDVSHQLPDLIFRNFGAPGWHPFAASFGDRVKDLVVTIAEKPNLVAQARPHTASRVAAMASGAVVPVKELASFLQSYGIVSQGIGGEGDILARAGDRADSSPVGRQRDRSCAGGRILLTSRSAEK